MIVRSLLVASLSLSFVACEASKTSTVSLSEDPKTDLALSDVAILLPFEKRPELLGDAPLLQNGPIPFINPALLGELSTILVEDKSIHEQESFAFGRIGDASFEADVTNVGAPSGESPYRLVSLRIDPCVNELQMKAGDVCEGNIRLVFQPLMKDGEAVFAKDSNIHLIYRLNEKEFSTFVEGMRNLRKAAGKEDPKDALRTHPVIAREGAQGPYFQGLLDLLSKYTVVSRLKRVAFFGDTDRENQGHWPMLAFNVENEKVVRVSLDQVGKEDGEIQKSVQRLHGNHEHLEEPKPRSTLKDSLFPELKLTGEEEPDVLQALLKTFMQTKFENSFRIDNPLLHDPSTADCASCHVAEAQRFQLAPEMKAMNIPIPSGPIFTSEKWNLEGNVGPDFSRISLQIFSYFRTQPKVAKRVVNDAAHSVDILNRP